MNRRELFALPFAAMAQAPARRVKKLQIRILSTMLAETGIGEWGFAAMVEADGHRILFDAGTRPDTVLENAKALKVDLAVNEMLLSHFHGDHNGGLLTLRKSVAPSLGTCYVGEGIFLPRRASQFDEKERNDALLLKPAYEASGAKFVSVDKPTEIHPGIWLTGPVPRKYPERNWSGTSRIVTAKGQIEDTVPEDMSLVFDTEAGLVVLSGCGHSGIINTLEHARNTIRQAPIHAAIGGFHLFDASDETLAWTAGKLREFGLANFVGAHCTGIEAVYQIRQRTGLDRKHCIVGAVGAGFDLATGIQPGRLAR
ncbi:MAG: MBL fold metallo-hydrolase [Acidobacteria bacterium]|nr:MBL fold metallo-hydrolase [Acidobacteriota bacterium]